MFIILLLLSSLLQCCEEWTVIKNGDKALQSQTDLLSDIKDQKFHTPGDTLTCLMKACSKKNGPRSYAIAHKILKDPKVDINEQNEYGYTALHYLLQNKDAHKLFWDFKKYKANINLESESMHNCLHYAASNINPEILPKFIEFFHDQINYNTVNKVTKYGSTPLMTAVRNNNLDGVHCLLGLGAEVNLVAKPMNYTPIMCSNTTKMALKLMLAGSDLSLKAVNGHSGTEQVFYTNPLLLGLAPFLNPDTRDFATFGASFMFLTILGILYNKNHPVNQAFQFSDLPDCF